MRKFRTYNKEYASGFEHMVRDKLTWLGTTPNFWVLLGLGNLVGFAASLLMYKETFRQMFAYEGQGRFFKPIKSWFGSDRLSNVIWTSPSLILGGMLMQRRVGSMILLKYFGLAATSVYVS